MKLIAFSTSGSAPRIVPASHRREWMDATRERFAYRCLPMNIANAHGWLLLNEAMFSAHWTGGSASGDVRVLSLGRSDGRRVMATGHFGAGILTFQTHALFRTEPGYDLWVTGPVNCAKDGIAPLTGCVETDRTAAPFTVNWRFTRPNTTVVFEADEPVCQVFPVKRGLVEECEPEIRALESDQELARAHREWSQARGTFLADLKRPGSEACQRGWQRDYYGEAECTRSRPKEFKT